MIISRTTLWVCAVAIAISLPFFIYPVFLMEAISLALFACAFNLLLGYSGVLSFGHAALFGSAAYICGYAAKTWHLPTEIAIICGIGASGFLGFLYGLLATRQRGIYLAMITFALSQMIYFICVQAPFTGGRTAYRVSRVDICWASWILAIPSACIILSLVHSYLRCC